MLKSTQHRDFVTGSCLGVDPWYAGPLGRPELPHEAVTTAVLSVPAYKTQFVTVPTSSTILVIGLDLEMKD